MFKQLTILLDEAEQNILICLWQADQLFTSAFSFGKYINLRDTDKS